MAGKKKIIGILGAPGSGKSAVAAEFVRLGCGLVDADAIAHKLLEREDIKAGIGRCFGEAVFSETGAVDRAKLAEAVFYSPDNVARINSLIHPEVTKKVEKLIAEYNAEPGLRAIVLDIPLLIETGFEKTCYKLIFVDCRSEIRAERLEKAAVPWKNQLKKRENFQISLDTKVKISHYTVDNNSGLSAMAEQVARIFSDIIK